MKVHVFQHASFEQLGNINPWLRERDAQVTVSRLYDTPELPSLAELSENDLLITLGGPMSVNDEAQLPWLTHEKRLLAAAIERGMAVLGVCLGAQLIAASQGAGVYRAAEKEIGWFPVMGTSRAPTVFQFPEQVEVLHWHRETCDLPAQAVNLAQSAACLNQAFQLGSRVIGLQFHLETTRASVKRKLDHCAADLFDGPYVQTAEQIQAAQYHHYRQLQTLMHSILDYLAA